ncbi:MAG TPA: hypothetical protein VLL48_07500 [Longimicrobiales bacterium]|nr:hypothetical protein [Longimicrobiales bacterium]
MSHRWGRAAVAMIAAPALLGCNGDEGAPGFHPDRRSSVDGVPVSTQTEVVALPGGMACTPDTYLHRVHCHPMGQGSWSSFGREGSGPGEFRSPGPMVSWEGADSVLAVVDLRTARLSVFTRSGRYVSSVPVPRVFWPISPVRNSQVSGIVLGYPRPGSAPVLRIARVDVSDGAVNDILIDPPPDSVTSPGPTLGRGVALSTGELVVHHRGHRFHRYGPDGRPRGTFSYPPHLTAPIYPSDRDMETYADNLRRLQRSEPSQAQLEEWARRPLTPVLAATNPMEGPMSTVWVASSRGRIDQSFIDVFREGDYLGAVIVRDRLLDFDLVGDTLIALVERSYEEDGVTARGVDWYGVGDWWALRARK